MKIVRDGVEISYKDEGEGLPVVLLHGFPFSGRMWNRQIAALAPSHRVITPDFRGFGDSGGVPSTVVDCTGNGVRIVREGAIPESEIDLAIREVRFGRGAA